MTEEEVRQCYALVGTAGGSASVPKPVPLPLQATPPDMSLEEVFAAARDIKHSTLGEL